jgi:hypothetical protein
VKTCIVAATGPSLTQDIADQCQGQWVIAVNDAYRLIPFARTLYAADTEWWLAHDGCPDFAGEKLTCSLEGRIDHRGRRRICKRYGLSTVLGKRGSGYSTNPKYIHFGSNSTFQAVNIALHRGADLVIMVGLDMHGDHFFGKHPKQLRNIPRYEVFVRRFTEASRVNKDLRIINATPGSHLSCYPIMTLAEALSEVRGTKSPDIDRAAHRRK